VALLVFAALGKSIVSSSAIKQTATVEPAITIRKIGGQLMADYVLPLEAIALLLTAAMIGAVIIAMQERKGVK
jgi:NADH-quinone oxidoreductase subunit J